MPHNLCLAADRAAGPLPGIKHRISRFRRARVTFDPDHGDGVLVAQIQQLLPEVGVQGLIGFVSLPAVCPPALRPPLRDGIGQILRVRIEGYDTVPFKCL